MQRQRGGGAQRRGERVGQQVGIALADRLDRGEQHGMAGPYCFAQGGRVIDLELGPTSRDVIAEDGAVHHAHPVGFRLEHCHVREGCARRRSPLLRKRHRHILRRHRSGQRGGQSPDVLLVDERFEPVLLGDRCAARFGRQ